MCRTIALLIATWIVGILSCTPSVRAAGPMPLEISIPVDKLIEQLGKAVRDIIASKREDKQEAMKAALPKISDDLTKIATTKIKISEAWSSFKAHGGGLTAEGGTYEERRVLEAFTSRLYALGTDFVQEANQLTSHIDQVDPTWTSGHPDTMFELRYTATSRGDSAARTLEFSKAGANSSQETLAPDDIEHFFDRQEPEARQLLDLTARLQTVTDKSK